MAIPGIQEIQSLATKYSKAQLQKMAQMGMIDPTKAVMAGMMIDRIQKKNMQPPQQTVAEEVMGGGAPPEGAPPPGVAGLPSGMPEEMAGGGIVAFADGGDTEDYAGGGVVAFADGKLVDSRNDPAMRIDPRVQAARDKDRYAILAQELQDAERRLAAGDARAAQDVEAIRREMRAMKPSPAAPSGIAGLLPSAQAAETRSAPAPKPVQAGASADEAVYSPEGVYMYGEQPTEPARRTIKPGEAYEPNIIRDILQGKPNAPLPPISKPKPVEKAPEAAPPTSFTPKVETAPIEKVAEEKAEMGPAKPSFADRLLALQTEAPEGKDLASFTKQRTEAEAAAGVDPQLFDKLRQDLATTKGSLKDRADKAAGHALMMFGAGMLGGRRGQEFQTASRSAQQSLMMYMNNMDKITENEEKINSAMRELAVSENQYKRSGLERDLARMEKHQDKIDAINLKNTEIKAKALESLQKAAVDQLQVENPALWTTLNNIAEEQRKKGNRNYTTLDALRDYQGTQKSGELNRGALFALWSKMDPAEKFAYKNDFEQFIRQYQGGAGGGGGKSGVKFLGYE